MRSEKRRWRISRRGFLIGFGLLGSGLAIGLTVGVREGRLALARYLDDSTAPGTVKAPPNLWFEILPDSTVKLYSPKVEMGQGVHTALAQIAAEELEIEWKDIKVVQASTARGLNDPFGTGGSSSINSLFDPLREVAATLREMIRIKAADLWSLSPELVVATTGYVFQRNDFTEKLSYGEIAVTAGEWEVPEVIPTLKPRREYRYIGKSLPRVDSLSKLTGVATYGYDKHIDGMGYGVVARPKQLGSELEYASPGRAIEQPGVITVLVEDGFAGVVATSRKEATEALKHLELHWSVVESFGTEDIERVTTVQDGRGVLIQRHGRTLANLQNKDQLISAEYRSPPAYHAHLEPQAALVDVRSDGVQAWVSTQSPGLVQKELASILKRKRSDVEVMPTYLGGGFGRKLNVEVAGEAARLSQAAGRPVHVGWTREEDFLFGSFRPPTHSVLRGSLKGGRVEAIEHQLASGDVMLADLPAVAGAVMGADFAAWKGATIQYAVPHRRVTQQRVSLPIKTTWWRGLGLLANTFAVESFFDELAINAGVDPLEFRINHLSGDEEALRLRKVLETAAEHADWGGPLPTGRAQGIACCTNVRTVVAQIAEVSVENNVIYVHRVTAAVDPGLVINPDGAIAQTQGSIVMALSSTLKENVSFSNSLPRARNFDQYPLLTLRETPEIDVVLIESGEEPFGMGEPPMGPVAAAVANAVFALTGKRIRRMPLDLS